MGKVFGAIIEKPQNYFQKIAVAIGEFFSAQDLIEQWAEGNHSDILESTSNVCSPIVIIVVGVEAKIETLSSKEFTDRVGKLGGPEFMALEIYEQMRCLEELGDLRSIQTEIETIDMSQVGFQSLPAANDASLTLPTCR